MGARPKRLLATLTGMRIGRQKMAKNIGYPELEKAYLAGLTHDLGLLVNSLLYNDKLRECLDSASKTHTPLHLIEEQILGFTHCDSGRMLCEHWRLSKELADCAAEHHALRHQASPAPLLCIVHLSDLLCRMRHLGYGYEEIMGVELGADAAWEALCIHYPELAKMDVIRFTLDIDGSMEEIRATVDSVFGPVKTASSASAP